MPKQITSSPILLCLLLFACERTKQQQRSYDFIPPEIIEAKTYSLPPATMRSPKIIQVSGVKKKVMGQPEVVHITSNVFPAIATSVIVAEPQTLIPSDDENFVPPKTVAAIEHRVPAGAPEIIAIKDPVVKENNPANFSTIKAVHGLNSNEISSLCQDKAGNLWIGQWWGGVSRYNGLFLANYSVAQGLCSDVVNCIIEDRSNNIWIGTANGVNKLNGKYITRYSMREGLSDNYVWDIMQDKKGDVWFATNNGLNRFDGHSFTHYTTAQGLPGNIIRGMEEDNKGNLWFGANGGLTRFNGQSFQNYTTALNLNDTTEVISIHEDVKGNVWFATNDNGLFKYDGQAISRYTAKGGLSSDKISKIAGDYKGNLWIATWDHGVNIYDGKSFTHLGVEQGLSNDMVTSILEDSSKNIWLATTAGVCKYNGKLFSHIMPIRQEEVECVLADSKGNIWMGSGVGNCLNKYDGQGIARYTTKEGLFSTSINQIIEDSAGNIWFGGRGGIEKYDGKFLYHYSTSNGLINNDVFCLATDKKGNLWIGTEKGLSKFDGKSFTNYSKAQGLIGETIYSVLEDHSGIIWIGTSDKGICTFDGVSFTHYNMDHSLSDAMVIGMLEDKSRNLWFCTNRGVNKFDRRYFTWYTTKQGLTHNIVKNVLEDENADIWVGTINGMNRLRRPGTQPGDINNERASLFKKYTVSDGFSGGGTYENSITQDKSGNIWIGATDRITNYHPEGDIPDTIVPAIQLTGVAPFGENINWLEAEKKKDTTIVLGYGTKFKNFKFNGLTYWHNQPNDLLLVHSNNYITFHFIGITTNRPKEIRYQYILEGLDENRSAITSEPTATYNNLPHGKFIFKVRAVNSEGYWSSELQYPFEILPPWWKSWWAYLAYTAGFVAIVWFFSLYRSRWLKAENLVLEDKVSKRTHELEQSLEERYRLGKQVESQQALLNERLRISRELHDDIGSTLGSISIYSEVARKRAEKNETTIDVLSKIGFASRELIDKMSDIVWSLNPNNADFEHLENRMIAFSAMIFTPRNILYDFNADEGLKTVQLTGEMGKNIFLIFKEAVYNMVKYADCKKATITLTHCKNDLVMIIRDDGKGFDISAEPVSKILPAGNYVGGNGIANMRARANDMQAKLFIHSNRNEGTTIQLVLPL